MNNFEDLKPDNDNQKGVGKKSPQGCYLLPEGFLKRFEMVEGYSEENGGIGLYKELYDYCMEGDLLSASLLLKCTDMEVNRFSEFSLEAQESLKKLPEEAQNAVLIACEYGHYDYARKILKVINLGGDF